MWNTSRVQTVSSGHPRACSTWTWSHFWSGVNCGHVYDTGNYGLTLPNIHKTLIEVIVASGAFFCSSFLLLTSVEASQCLKIHQWLRNGLKLSRMMRCLSSINAGIAPGGDRKETLKVYIWYCVYVCQMASNMTPNKKSLYLDVQEAALDCRMKRGSANRRAENKSHSFNERHQRKQ